MDHTVRRIGAEQRGQGHEPPHAFVERFRNAWASRDPERLGELLHPDVELLQPVQPTLRGRQAAVRALSGVFELLPDLEITIHDSVAEGDRVFIDFSFRGTAGKRRLDWRLVDHIELCDGLVRRRRSYFDPLPVFWVVLLQPRLWARFIARIRERRA